MLLFLVEKFWRVRLINFSTPLHATLFIVLCIGWYIYVSQTFTSFVVVGDHVLHQITQFASPEVSTAQAKLHKGLSFSMDVIKYMYLCSILFILIGFLGSIRNIKRKTRFTEYYVYSFLFLALGIFLINTTSWLGADRVYAVTLVFLAPFCVIGLQKIISAIGYVGDIRLNKGVVLGAFSVYLLILFLFNTGFMSAVVIGDVSPYPLIEKEEIIEKGSDYEKLRLTLQYTSDYDLASSKWFVANYEKGNNLYLSTKPTGFKGVLFYDNFGDIQPYNSNELNPKVIERKENYYVYIGMVHTLTGIIKTGGRMATMNETIKLSSINFRSLNEIYDNEISKIYKQERG